MAGGSDAQVPDPTGANRRINGRRRGSRRRAKPGESPGVLVAPPGASPTRVSVCAFGPDGVDEPAFASVATLLDMIGRRPVTWVRVSGLGDVALLHEIAGTFQMHPLALEDVGNTHQRAKVEDYDERLFATVRAPVIGEEIGTTEQLALFLGSGFLLTFEERESPLLEPILTRIRQGRGRIRQRGADYLAYAVIDTVVDSYFPMIERVTMEFDEFEIAALSGPISDAPAWIYRLQRQLSVLRQHAWPHREAVGRLRREESSLITKETRVFLRDCADHATHVVETIDQMLDRGQSLMGLLLSLAGARMNEIMKVLTIIATIFIPLTFVVGVYGMNFDANASPWNMPELKWAWGYPVVMVLMAAIAVAMVFYFRRLGWIGPKSREEDPLM